VSNTVLKAQYKQRSKQLRRGTGSNYDFFRGHKVKETDVLAVLRDLITGMYSCVHPIFYLSAQMIRIFPRACKLR
jgi:hypothetical protein